MYLIRMAWAHPEQLREGVNDDGKRCVERIPGHPKRPAYPHELNTWWEGCAEATAVALRAAGKIVKVA